MRTMLQRYPDKAGALREVHRLMAVLHVEALLHASWAHQRAVAPLQHSVHDAGARRPPAKPPPQMPNHRAVEALQTGIDALSAIIHAPDRALHALLGARTPPSCACKAGQRVACFQWHWQTPEPPPQVPHNRATQALLACNGSPFCVSTRGLCIARSLDAGSCHFPYSALQEAPPSPLHRCVLSAIQGVDLTAEVARTRTERSAGGMRGLCSQNTIGMAVGSAE